MAHVTHSISPQAKALTRHVLLRLLVQIVVFSVVYLALILFLSGPIDRCIVQIGKTYAPWTYYQSPLDYFEQRGLISQSVYQINALSEPNDNDGNSNDIQIQPAPNGGVFVRDMTLVNTLRALRLPVGIGLYLGMLVLLFFLSLRRVLFYFDDLSIAVQRMILEPTQEVSLPVELAITQATLEQVRSEKVAREEEARDAEKRKNELVAYLAHDIRTPLTSVIGYLDLLRDNSEDTSNGVQNTKTSGPVDGEESKDLFDSEKSKRYLNLAWEKSLHLNDLVNEFFEITRLNVDGHSLLVKPVNLELFVAQVLEELWPQAADKALTYETQVDHSLEISVDPQQFARALSNIVKNAIAYADEGSSIKVAAVLGDKGMLNTNGKHHEETNAGAGNADNTDTNAGGGNANSTDINAGAANAKSTDTNARGNARLNSASSMVALSVTNHGKEIAQANLERIFERFYREDEARQIARGGAGLGLSIASEIVQAHGGYIKAHSAGGITTFILYVPACEATSKEPTDDSRIQND